MEMEEHDVDILAGELLGLLREDAQLPSPRLWVRASKEFEVQSDFDRAAAGIGEDDDLMLVTVHGLLDVEPRGSPAGWILQVRASDVVGVMPDGAAEDYQDDGDMTLEAFEEEFLVPERGEVEIVVLTEDDEAWARFQRWLGPGRGGGRVDGRRSAARRR